MPKLANVIVAFECDDEEAAGQFLSVLVSAMNQFALEAEKHFDGAIRVVRPTEGAELVPLEQQQTRRRDEV
jgi:hypothetical protein